MGRVESEGKARTRLKEGKNGKEKEQKVGVRKREHTSGQSKIRTRSPDRNASQHQNLTNTNPGAKRACKDPFRISSQERRNAYSNNTNRSKFVTTALL